MLCCLVRGRVLTAVLAVGLQVAVIEATAVAAAGDATTAEVEVEDTPTEAITTETGD